MTDSTSEGASSFADDLLGLAEAQGRVRDWQDPADLARWSMEALADDATVGRVLKSRGRLRLFGSAISGHSVRLNDVGGALTTFQRLVSAVGASIEGFKSSRGALPTAIQLRTNLRLSAAPFPGSVVLTLTPEQSPADELYPTADVPMVDDQRPLADRSLEQVINLLTLGVGADASTTELRTRLAELGPRVSNAARWFLKVAADDQLDVGLQWMEPHHATRATAVTSSQARFIETAIVHNALDTEEVSLSGVVRTISDRRPIEVEVEGQVLRLHLGDDVPAGISDLRVGDSVQAVVSASTELRAGGDEVTTYTVVSLGKVGVSSETAESTPSS